MLHVEPPHSTVFIIVSIINIMFLLFLQVMCGHVKRARITYKLDYRDLNIQLLQEVQVIWSTNLHLKILCLLAEINDFSGKLKGTYVSVRDLRFRLG